MTWFCKNCNKPVSYGVVLRSESCEIGGCQITVPQKHAYCLACGYELYPDDLMDENTYVAHHAYCIAKAKEDKLKE